MFFLHNVLAYGSWAPPLEYMHMNANRKRTFERVRVVRGYAYFKREINCGFYSSRPTGSAEAATRVHLTRAGLTYGMLVAATMGLPPSMEGSRGLNSQVNSSKVWVPCCINRWSSSNNRRSGDIIPDELTKGLY